jgi:polyhydroxyalkanoate synthase
MDSAIFALPSGYPLLGYGAGWAFHEQIDQIRRWQGKVLDALGFGPIETPSRVVLSEPGVTLRAYEDDGDEGPLLLIVPAPIKHAYIWDLVPWVSVVRQCVCNAIRVYLIQWERPWAAEQGYGLAEYADRLILDCLDAMEVEVGQSRAFLAGHSLGGTFAAIFSALHPERVQGLVLIGAPLHFGPGVGALGRLVAVAPRAHFLTAMPGNVPGSFLDMASLLASPMTFGAARWMDWLRSFPDPQAIDTHLRVERWTLDEMPMASRLFHEVVEELYREDRFLHGRLMVRGQRAAPTSVDAPLLSVVDARCPIAPPRSVLPFHHAVRSAETQLLWYEGDAGVVLQHVGMLVGKSAHQSLWPKILHWIHARGKAGSGGGPAWADREGGAPGP